MSTDQIRERADRRFEQALAAAGARDPREFYRESLKELRARDQAAFREAVDYFEQTLLPAVARDDSDPLAEWLEYGRLLASLACPGETVQLDASGHATPYSRPVPADHLVLHLPSSARDRALPVGLPAELSPAQRAAYSLLVERKTA